MHSRSRKRLILILTVVLVFVLGFIILYFNNTFFSSQRLVTDRALLSLQLGDNVEPGLTVSAIRTERRLDVSDVTTSITLRGPLTIISKYQYATPAYLIFSVTSKDQLPFSDVQYVSSFGGLICFDNNSEVKKMLSSADYNNQAIMTIEDLTISYAVTEGCSTARLAQVIHSDPAAVGD